MAILRHQEISIKKVHRQAKREVSAPASAKVMALLVSGRFIIPRKGHIHSAKERKIRIVPAEATAQQVNRITRIHEIQTWILPGIQEQIIRVCRRIDLERQERVEDGSPLMLGLQHNDIKED